MCGFNFYDPHGHIAGNQMLHSIQLFGNKGNMRLLGYDWETNGVIVETSEAEQPQLVCTDKGGYVWQEGKRIKLVSEFPYPVSR